MSERSETSFVKSGSAKKVDSDSLLVRPKKDRTHHLGRALVSHFYKVAKTAGMFDFTNVITRDAVRTFLGTLYEILGGEPQVCLQMTSDCLFVNETRLKIDFEGFTSFKYVVEALKEREIGSIHFLQETSEEDLHAFLQLFVQTDGRAEDPRNDILAGLQAAGVCSIWVEEIRDLPDQVASTDMSEDYREVSINTYLKSIFVAKQFMENFRTSGSTHFRKARRLVHSVVDLVAQDDTTLLALTQIKNFDDSLFTHSANVCVLAVSLGQNLGLGKALLGSLGLAGLLHDVGLTEVPRDIVARRDALGAAERAVYEEHPSIGAKVILKNQGVTEVSIRCALAAFEHHLNADHSGFPILKEPRPLSLLGRIISIVDFYDAITTPDMEGGRTFTPEEALRLMAHEGDEVFDPVLVKVFVNSVGTYPLGTVVRLDSGEFGLVHRRNPHFTQLSRPLVKIITDEYGMPAPPPHQVVDLSEWDRERDRFTRTILETMPPYEHFGEVQEFTDLL